jgi:multidrug efflux system membrane fusion protein
MHASKTTLGVVVAVVTAAILGALLLEGAGRNSTARQGASPPPGPNAGIPVPVTPVVKQTVPVYLDYVGTTEAIRSVALQAKVTGYLAEPGAQDGADVAEGDLLYRIDARDYRAALERVKAQAERDAAALDYSRSLQHRNAQLSGSGWTTKDAYEQTTSAMHQAEANLAADQAAIRAAENDLGYAEIHAPFAGRLGKSLVHEGALITASGTEINTLVQLDPIYATFNPSETDLATIQKRQAAGKIPAEVLLPGDTQPRFHGRLSFLDNVVDRTTGTIVARATIDNADRMLIPGQYIRVRLHITDRPDVLLVPQDALGTSQIGKFVYVVGEGNKVEQRYVSPGANYGKLVVIESGVKEGESVIVGNLQKIGPGAPVQPLPAQSSGAS